MRPCEKIKGWMSWSPELIGAPTFLGVDQGSSTLCRVENQMSLVTAPVPSEMLPGRLEKKYISRPLWLTDGRCSEAVLFTSTTGAPRPQDPSAACVLTKMSPPMFTGWSLWL